MVQLEGKYGLDNTDSNIITSYVFLEVARLIATTSPDASQNIRAQQTDRKDDQSEGHDQVDQVTDDRADLELSRTDFDGERRDTLASRSRRRKERHKDTVIQRLEECSHDTSEIKRRSQNDDVLGIQHLLNQLECF